MKGYNKKLSKIGIKSMEEQLGSATKIAKHERKTPFYIYRIATIISYIVCLSLFTAGSWAVFKNFSSGAKIRSAKVIPPDAGVLDSPILLVCNSSAYKEPVVPFTFESFKNNTISKNEILIDAFMINDARNGILAYNPSRITEHVKELSTMFFGNCIIIEKAFKVNCNQVNIYAFVGEFILKYMLKRNNFKFCYFMF